jgi:hypothetical protein
MQIKTLEEVDAALDEIDALGNPGMDTPERDRLNEIVEAICDFDQANNGIIFW